MRLTGFIVVVTGSAWLGACGADQDARDTAQLDIAVESDPGVPLARVAVRVEGSQARYTDDGGLVRFTVSGRPGKVIRVDHDCPQGYRRPDSGESFRLRSYRADETPRPIEIRLRCIPKTRIAAFLIRAANGSGLPVSLNGQVVARTNDIGVALFSDAGTRGTEYLVQIDARVRPELRPRRTSHLFKLPDADELFIVDQSFEDAETRARPRKRRRQIIRIE